MKIGIIGSGLLGTSLALALHGEEIWISDQDPNSEALAADLTGARVGRGECDLLVVATPVNAISEVVLEAFSQNLAPTITDFGSVKTKPLVEIQHKSSLDQWSRYVPGHPMAGRETHGPRAARGDLFQGRPWLLTPVAGTAPAALESVEEVAVRVGSRVVSLSPEEHDRAMASLSHLPQVVASALAGQVASRTSISLAGQGLRDMVRIAASDPSLWVQILTANAAALSAELRELISTLENVDLALNELDEKSIYRLIESGAVGRSRLPGKHGGKSTKYVSIPVVVDDRPGQLSALFHAAAECGVNIEDLAMEHTPGQATGLVELSVAPDVADGFIDFLLEGGWRVHALDRQRSK